MRDEHRGRLTNRTCTLLGHHRETQRTQTLIFGPQNPRGQLVEGPPAGRVLPVVARDIAALCPSSSPCSPNTKMLGRT